MIYQPEVDSYLLADAIKDCLSEINDKSFKILDMGSGSGIQAQTCKEMGFDNILCLDINPEAIEHLKKQGFTALQSDLFSNIAKEEKFDLILFNPPYLPLDPREPIDSRLATTAGKNGYEIIIKFLEEAKEHLNKDGKILLLFSSLSRPKVILSKAEELGYSDKLVENIKIDFEELFVYEIML